MKIPKTLSASYEDIYPDLERLRAFVEPRILDVSNRYRASYTWRIKSAESILIKAEKEGYEFPFSEMEDLFACTIIVSNSKHVNVILDEIENLFVLEKKRQRELKPFEFDYNDLNLTFRIPSEQLRDNDPIKNFLFEVQIKTLLQEAWAKASHDVIYKSKKKTWGISRIAGQLRALLEMADAVLSNLEGSASILQEQKDYEQFTKVNQIVDFFEKYWSEEKQPQHSYRSAQIANDYLSFAQIDADTFEILLQSDKYKPYLQARTLTPTQVIFIILYLEKGIQFVNRFGKRKVLVTSEMTDLCPELKKVSQSRRMNFEPISIPVS